MKGINLTIRFLLELALLAALGFWGAHAEQAHSTLSRVALAVGAPLIVAIVWGLAISPKAPAGLSPVTRLALSLPMFGVGACALYVSDATQWSIAFGIVAAVNTTALIVIEVSAGSVWVRGR
ncbi:MAG: YrdB family protein [bacterium]